MDQHNLSILSKNLSITPIHIVRENLEVMILNTLAESDIIKQVIFYGGTSLRLGYGSPRFSEDLDFLMIKKISASKLQNLLKNFIDQQDGARLKDFREKQNTLFALLNFKTSLLKHPLNIKIEICKKKNGVQSEFIPLSSPCSHLTPIIPTARIESLKELKKAAILGRDQARDWFDLWFICKYLKEPFQPPKVFPFEKTRFKNELKTFMPRNKWLLIEQLMP